MHDARYKILDAGSSHGEIEEDRILMELWSAGLPDPTRVSARE
jgi:hypothetical protein